MIYLEYYSNQVLTTVFHDPLCHKLFCESINIPSPIYPSSRACLIFPVRLIKAWKVEKFV